MENLYENYMNIPVVTRLYNTACIITTLLVQLDVLSPFNLYFNRTLVFKHYQLWRLLTNFLYLGTFSISFLFNLIFMHRYCRMLEEGSFRGRTADFIVMFVFGGVWMIAISTYLNVLFLGQAFTIMLVYVWSRRNPMIRVNFFGILNFQAPNLPWVILGFSVLLGSPILTDLVGMVVGHLYYFLEDVFPHQPGGFRIIRTPKFLKKICDSEPDDPNYNPIPEERPGGYEWGNPNADEH